MERIIRNRDMLIFNGPFAISAMDEKPDFFKNYGKSDSLFMMKKRELGAFNIRWGNQWMELTGMM